MHICKNSFFLALFVKFFLFLLNDQFNQQYVTLGFLDLKKIRLYNKNFELVAESSSGVNGLAEKLPEKTL